MELPSLLGEEEDASLEEALEFLDSYDFSTLEMAFTAQERDITFLSSIGRLETSSVLPHPGVESAQIISGLNDGGAVKKEVYSQRWGHQHDTSPGIQGRLGSCPQGRPQDLGTPAMKTIHSSAMVATSTRPAQSSRRRRTPREQLIQLRGVVANLDVQLKRLQNRAQVWLDWQLKAEDKTKAHESIIPTADANERNASSTITATSGEGQNGVMWRQIATQQYHERCRAEQENAKLRERLEVEIRKVRRIEALIESHSSLGAQGYTFY